MSFAPWRGGRQHAELMQAMPYTGGVGVLLRDHGVGEVRTGRDGEPVVRYKLTPKDVEHMRRGVRGAARVVEAMGARRVYSSHSDWVSYEPGRARRRGRLHAPRRRLRLGRRPGADGLVPHHGQRPHRPLADRLGLRSHRRGVEHARPVRDGRRSAFPTASGVNPMVTIEALSHMNARGLAAKLGAVA